MAPPGEPGPRHAARRPSFAAWVGLAALVGAVFIAWAHFGWGGHAATVVFSDTVSTLVPLAAAGACLEWSTRTAPELRKSWRWIGAGCFAWALGQAGWTAIELRTKAPPVTPSIADAGYLLFPVLATWGVARFGRRDSTDTGYLRAVLDASIVGSSLVFLAFAFGLEGILLRSQRTDLALIIDLLYPFTDAALLGLALMRMSRAPPGKRDTLGLLCLGFVLLVAADFWFLIVDAQGTYGTGGIMDGFWVVGFLLIGLAALRPARLDAALPSPRQTPALALLPLGPFMLAAVAAVVADVRDGQLSNTLFWTALTVVMLVVLRSMVMLLDNLRLVDREAAASAELRREKAVRTRMMNAITHDMLNAMSPIRLQLKMLGAQMLGPQTPKQQTAVTMVSRNSERMARLAMDIRDGANIEEGRLHLEPQDIDLAATVRDAVAARQAEAQERGVGLGLGDGAPTPVRADPQRITQVVDNLLSNALKFTPRDGRIDVTVANAEGWSTVRVQDTGRGIAPDDIGKLFQPYSQVHDPAEVKEHGTGLGLYISRAIVERHGGRVWAESGGRGQGCTFLVLLPAAPPAPTATPVPQGPPALVPPVGAVLVGN